jgi:hypothetical protein
MATATNRPDPRPVGASDPTPHPPGAAEQVAAEQGTMHTATVEHIESLNAQLWDDDEDFERFLGILRDAKQRG